MWDELYQRWLADLIDVAGEYPREFRTLRCSVIILYDIQTKIPLSKVNNQINYDY